ncbi:MAG TPA: DUF427 domain-containing protein [Propionibacteriaceae bacterium]|nr:DUF427 domain-containing protein [Propionibacteriaceae bacterium]
MSRSPTPEPAQAGQESVWDFPRPPALRPSTEHITVTLGGVVICETDTSLQVLETSHPPTYYLPRDAFRPGSLRQGPGHSFCEWKGVASYLDVIGGDQTAIRAGWWYPTPTAAFTDLARHVALYPGAMDACLVDGERVRAQPGGFYGGWVTSRVSGPFKGVPGSQGW